MTPVWIVVGIGTVAVVGCRLWMAREYLIAKVGAMLYDDVEDDRE